MKKVLIADDNAEVRMLVLVTLDLGQLEFLQASNGTTALEVARKEHPDLIILDVMMPGGLDGYSVCDALKKDPKTQDITVMLLTARGQEVDLARGKQVGADEYFVKPFSPRTLLEKVYNVLKI